MTRGLITRDSDGKTVDLDKQESEHAEIDAKAKRVILVDEDGNPINDSNPIKVNTELTLDELNIDNIDIQDISAGTQTNDVKITLDGEDVTIIPGPIQGRTFTYEDTSFLTGDSPATHDINTDLGRNAVDGYIINDGSGNFTIAISDDGTNFGSEHTLKKGDVLKLTNLNIDKIRVTWVANSAYRILVI